MKKVITYSWQVKYCCNATVSQRYEKVKGQVLFFFLKCAPELAEQILGGKHSVQHELSLTFEIVADRAANTEDHPERIKR